MPARGKRIPSALKHGGYCATLLPGEDPAAFKKLHDGLIAELSPVGALEEDIVASIAGLVWRKRHLATFGVNEKMRRRSIFDPDLAHIDPDKAKAYEEIVERWHSSGDGEDGPPTISPTDTPKEAMAKYSAFIKEDPQEERFFSSGKITTIEEFMKVLAVEERLDSMIDRCLKRLLFLRGLKSLTPTKSAAASRAEAGA